MVVAWDPVADLNGLTSFPEPDPEPVDAAGPWTPDFGDVTPDFASETGSVATLGREVLAFFLEEFGCSWILGLGHPMYV